MAIPSIRKSPLKRRGPSFGRIPCRRPSVVSVHGWSEWVRSYPDIGSGPTNTVSHSHSILSFSRWFLQRRLRLAGFKRIPKFGVLLGFSFFLGEGENPGFAAATAASILSAPFINPIRMIEKQQRAFFKQTGAVKPIWDILKESAAKNFAPLFRGTIPLMGHSLASALLGLVGQPRLQRYIQQELGDKTSLGRAATGLVASSIVSPIYVVVTNPLSRLEVIMQTNSIQGKSIGVTEAIREMMRDMAAFGLRGVFRGQGIGIAKAVVSLTLFHEGRHFLQDFFRSYNERHGYYTPE